jgi:hypothetical protein
MAKAKRELAQRAHADALPLAVWLKIFSLLPVDARACCCAVRRAWRAALADACLWRELDVSWCSGVSVRVTGAVLAGAAARARGTLRVLNVTGCSTLRREALLAVLSANAEALRVVHALGLTLPLPGGRAAWLSCEDAQALLTAAPRLQALDADVCCCVEDAPALLRRAPPFAPLRLHHLELHDSRHEVARKAEFEVNELLTNLTGATLGPAPLGDAVTALAAALRDTDAAGAPAILTLSEHLSFGGPLASELAALLAALEGHRSVRALRLHSLDMPSARPFADAGGYGVPAALRALLAADAPALRALHVSAEASLDAALAPLADALPENTHLRTLTAAGGGLSRAFVRHRLLPALRANSGLRALTLADDAPGAPPYPAGRAAMDFVRNRAAAAGGAPGR